MDMERVFSLIQGIAQDIETYDTRKVARSSANGLVVSTAYTSDEGYETALIDGNGVHPVERYGTREEAEKGHAVWVAFAESDINTVNELDGWGIVPEEEITLVRQPGMEDE
jgi:hypothetical protein